MSTRVTTIDHSGKYVTKGAAMTERTEEDKEHLTLKWGSIKGWELKTDASMAALTRWHEAGKVSASAICQDDNEDQRAAIIDLIDVLDNDEVYLDWGGKHVSRDEAKEYIRNYRRGK